MHKVCPKSVTSEDHKVNNPSGVKGHWFQFFEGWHLTTGGGFNDFLSCSQTYPEKHPI